MACSFDHRVLMPSRDLHAEISTLISSDTETTLARIDSLARDFGSVVNASAEDATDDEHDPEGVTIAYERAQVSALLDQARRHLSDLEAARARLAGGAFGRCEKCGLTINAERLRALPTATQCVRCLAGPAQGLRQR